MKILHLRASNFYGGPERQLHFHARACRGSKHQVIAASFSEGGGEPEFLRVIREDGLATQLFAVGSAYDPRVPARLRHHLRRERIDVVCSHDYRTTLLTWIARRGTPARWIAFSRGSTQDDLKVRAFQAVEDRLLRRADHVVAVSQAQREKILRHGLDPERVSVVRNAIDGEAVARVEAIDLRARFGWPAEVAICASVGRFSREKGQIHLVRAAAVALRSEPRLRFVLFGDGPDHARIREEVSALGLADRVLCPGFERQALGCMRGADLVVNPSLSEGLPNVVLEAMALGVPVVATAVGGVPEILEPDVTGRLVEAGDEEALAGAVVGAVREPARSRAMALSARAFVQEHCSFQGQNRQLIELYRRVTS